MSPAPAATQAGALPGGSARFEERWEGVASAALLAWFAARVVYFALRVGVGIPPDESTHIGKSLAFAAAAFVPADSAATFEFGLIADQPNLYYLLMGKLLALNTAALHWLGWDGFLGVPDVLFLRLANAALGILTAVYAWRWLVLLTESPLVRLLGLVLVTHTLMFTALCGAVSYDNLVNLLAAASLYYLFAWGEERRVAQLGAFAVCVLGGCLTKTSFLPLAFVLVAVLGLRERGRLLSLPRRVAAALRPPSWRPALLWAAAALLLAANLELYGGNLLRYGHLVPDAAAVIGTDAALDNRIYARDYIFEQFKRGEIGYEEAVRLTARIRSPGDRRATLYLLQQARNPERLAATVMDPVQYAATWAHMTVEWVVGYTGHRSMRKSSRELYPYFAVFAAAGLVFIRRFRLREAGGRVAWAVLVAGFYAMVLMWAVNYRHYSGSGVMWLGTQGRYLFPVWVPLCGLTAYYLLRFLPRWAQRCVALPVAAWFVYGDLPFFLLNATPEWFIPYAPAP